MKTVVLTAGAQGLGLALTTWFARQGYRVVASYRSSDRQAEALMQSFPLVQMVQADLAQEEGRLALCQAAGPTVNVLVNNLGIYTEETIESITTEQFESIFHLSCTVGFDLVKRLAPRMSRGDHIIFVGDSGADRIEARAQATPYHIAKLGVHVLTRTFAQRLGPMGITVNMVSPGFLVNSVGQPGEPIPLGEPIGFEDIIQAIRFLTSEQARSVSGTNLLVNGGWNLG